MPGDEGRTSRQQHRFHRASLGPRLHLDPRPGLGPRLRRRRPESWRSVACYAMQRIWYDGDAHRRPCFQRQRGPGAARPSARGETSVGNRRSRASLTRREASEGVDEHESKNEVKGEVDSLLHRLSRVFGPEAVRRPAPHMETRPIEDTASAVHAGQVPELCRRGHQAPGHGLGESMHLVSQLLRKPPVPTQRAASRTIKQYARNAKAVPITTAEFYEHLLRCMPPTGWGHSLGESESASHSCLCIHRIRAVVANSGGPDSVCLLHLLAAVVKERGQTAAVHPGSKNNFPYRIYSLHINHRLQAANTDMQTTALHTAAMHHVRPVVESIPWGKGPFPPLPGKDQPMEEVTRKARAALIHLTMRRLNFNCIAYAHHADDQVETSIMRLLMGSKQWGASAMKPVRRWGMGDSSDICPAGSWGMNTWIIRPLLDVPKVCHVCVCITAQSISTYRAGQDPRYLRGEQFRIRRRPDQLPARDNASKSRSRLSRTKRGCSG